MKHKKKERKLIHCSKCGHGHTPKTGPCAKSGCGCHALDKPVGKPGGKKK